MATDQISIDKDKTFSHRGYIKCYRTSYSVCIGADYWHDVLPCSNVLWIGAYMPWRGMMGGYYYDSIFGPGYGMLALGLTGFRYFAFWLFFMFIVGTLGVVALLPLRSR